MSTDAAYLIKSKRARIFAAAAVAASALVCSWLVYGMEFNTANDTASLERAINEHAGYRHRVAAEITKTSGNGRWLTVYYECRNPSCQGSGYALFERGLNMRYAFVDSRHISMDGAFQFPGFGGGNRGVRMIRYFVIFVILLWGVIIARFMMTAKRKDFERDAGRAEFMEIADIYKLKNNKLH